jgi:SAM-dependent methyltransferase
MKSSTERFSDRVDKYVKTRPGYPEPLIEFLRKKIARPAVVADIGSGTGIFSRQLLKAGFEVFGIEPNLPMRSAAEGSIEDAKFHSVNGTAESTTLGDRSVDLITAAQAFHWFDRIKAKAEFTRILKPGGMLAIIWNERLDDVSDVNRRYEDILVGLAPEYPKVVHRNVSLDAIQDFFAPDLVTLTKFDNNQSLDRAGLVGRFESSSYVPNRGEPGHAEIVSAAEKLFDDCQVHGIVTISYETQVFWGQIGNGEPGVRS